MADTRSNFLSMTRRAALGTLAAGAAGWALMPSRPRSRAGVPRGRVELTYWEKWTLREGEALQRIVDKFNHMQDRIWVHRIPVADITSKAMVAIGGGDPPDLCGLFTYNVPIFAEAGALMAMDEFEGVNDGTPPFDPDAYAPAVERILSFGGRLWVGVNTCYTLALYYRPSHLAEIPGAEPPRTIGQLDTLAEQLTRRTGDGRIERAGFLQTMPGWWSTIWPLFWGTDVYDLAADRCTIGSDLCVQAYEWVQATAERYGPEASKSFSAAFSRDYHKAQDPFFSGKVSMICQGPWLANFAAAVNPGLDYAVVPFPVADELAGSGLLPGLLEADVLAIPRGCPHPEEAWTFFKYMQSRETQEALARAHCKPSPLRETSPGFFEGHGNPYVRVFDAIAKSPDVKVLPQTRVWKRLGDLSTSMFDAVWMGADVRQQLTTLESTVNEQIRINAERQKRKRGA